MKSVVESLRISLLEKSRSVSGVPFGSSQTMFAERNRLMDWIWHITGLTPPPAKRVMAALRRFHEDGQISSTLQARHMCHGCLVLYDRRAPYLIENARAFPLLLDYVDRLQHRPWIFRRAFMGLMRAYFTYEPGFPDPQAGPLHNRETGWQNRKLLRQFLVERQSVIHVPDFHPDWVSAILEHPAVFSERPCLPYVGAALQDDFTAFNDLLERLKIGQSSWLARGLVYEQIDNIIEKPDVEFRRHIGRSISLFNRHKWSVNKGLVKIINRYAESENTEANARLRDFSVAQWKNPWLSDQARGWNPVRADARRMVTSWVKDHLVRQFFMLLAWGTPFDERRAEFWAQYSHRIDVLYFAVGSIVATSGLSDFIEMRKVMEGHLLGLTNTSSPGNNACIILIGNYAIVEFGPNYVPAYVFDSRAQLPFELRRGFDVSADQTGLRNTRSHAFVQKLSHMDAGGGKWEESFEAALLRLGISRNP